MALLFHKTFETDLSEFSSTNVSNGTIEQSSSAGLNGTGSGVLCTATGASPSISGFVQHTFSGNSAMRIAWWTDLTALLVNTDSHFITLWNLRNGAGGNALARIRLGQISSVPQVYFDTYLDVGTPSQNIAFTLKPTWIEVEILRESVDTAGDGEMRVYFGGGDYPASGTQVAEFLTMENFVAYNTVTQARMGMLFGTAAITGSMKLDEIIARNDDEPILFGVSPGGLYYPKVRGRRR